MPYAGDGAPVDAVGRVAVAARPPALGLRAVGAGRGVPLEVAVARGRVVEHPVVEHVPVAAMVHPHEGVFFALGAAGDVAAGDDPVWPEGEKWP